MRNPAQIRGEADLIESIRNSDADAFGQLFRAFFSPLCAFAWRYVGSRTIAEDLAQNVFYHVWRNRKNWHPTGSLKTYLFGAVRNEALKHLKHQAIARREEQSAREATELHLPLPDEEASYQELREAIERFLQGLPERRRQIFIMHRQHGMTYREIAEVLGISVNTVETQIARVLSALRKMMADQQVL